MKESRKVDRLHNDGTPGGEMPLLYVQFQADGLEAGSSAVAKLRYYDFASAAYAYGPDITVHDLIGNVEYLEDDIAQIYLDTETGKYAVLGHGNRFERVKMQQTGGSDGTASTQATWTYSIKNWAETVTYATNVNPYDATTEPGGMIFRPAIGSWVAATEGSAMFIGGEPFIISCNEGESVAPCSAVGGASVAETNALSASFMLGGM